MKNNNQKNVQLLLDMTKELEKNRIIWTSMCTILGVKTILEITLFGIEGFLMSDLVKTTGYTEQSIRSIVKTINKKYLIIKINKEHKPYKYSIDLDVLSNLK